MADKTEAYVDKKADISKVPALPNDIASYKDIPKELIEDEVIITIENLHKKVFILWYKARFRPTTINLVANDIHHANKLGQAYCKKFNLKFISVLHFFVDLNAPPRDVHSRQDDV